MHILAGVAFKAAVDRAKEAYGVALLELLSYLS
jgi:hypothetical protein